MQFRHLALLAGAALAVPLEKRALSANDQNVLSLAMYLEQLELALYTGGCDDFTDADYTSAGFPAGFRDNVCVIAQHELEHARAMATILKNNGAHLVLPCIYDFPYSTPTQFVDLANMITSVGIGAYLGSSELLTDSPELEEATASILAAEARHDTYLRTGLGADPFPAAFDTGLTALWAYNLAAAFVVSCPLPLPGQTRLPGLTVAGPVPSRDQKPVAAGAEIALRWDPAEFPAEVNPGAKLYVAVVNRDVGAPVFVEVGWAGYGRGTVVLPGGLGGAVFACLTTFAGGLTLSQLSQYGTLAGPVQILLS